VAHGEGGDWLPGATNKKVRPKILVIDDSSVVLDVLEEALSAHDWQVMTAGGADEALHQAADFCPDVVICDLHMDGMDGKQAHRHITGLDPTCAFIILSSENELSVVLELVREGVFEYVQKDSGTEAVVAAVERALRHVWVDREHLRLSADLRASNRQLQTRLDQLEALVQLLPRPVVARTFEVAAGGLPAGSTGSDYHDSIPDGGKLWLAIGDVSGESFAARVIMLAVRSGLATLVRGRTDLEPGEAFRAMNDLLADNVGRGMSEDHQVNLTLLRCADDGTVTYAGGTQPLIVWRARARICELLSTSRPPLGMQGGMDFPDATLRLAPGDTILLHSDGVTRTASPDAGAIGLERLVDWFSQEGGRPLDGIRDALIARVRGWHPAPDRNATVLVARYLGGSEPTAKK
jgi:sigma-B regulation protein RsbU (phosphoserine phosphatase)